MPDNDTDLPIKDRADTIESAPQYVPEEQGEGGPINASGHVQELERNFSLVSLAGIGITTGNVWPAVGGSILVALYNGGPPGTSAIPLHCT